MNGSYGGFIHDDDIQDCAHVVQYARHCSAMFFRHAKSAAMFRYWQHFRRKARLYEYWSRTLRGG